MNRLLWLRLGFVLDQKAASSPPDSMSMNLRHAEILTVIAFMMACSSGCASDQRAQQQEIAEARQECDSLYADPSLNPIRAKVALANPEDQTFEMLTNTETVSPVEKPVIVLWVQRRDQCWQSGAHPRSMLSQQISAVMDSSRQAVESMIAELYLGQITYGQLANLRAKNLAELKEALANIQQALIVQNQQSQFQAQQLANQAEANWNSEMQTQALRQMRTQMSAPVSCTTIGSITNCY
jgi:hypothetical protein